MSTRLLRMIGEAELGERAPAPLDAGTLADAAIILEEIRIGKEAAARAHARRLGDLADGEPVVYSARELAEACDRLPRAQRELLERVAGRVAEFARRQRACLRELSMEIPGGMAGHTIAPVAAAGCYAPGGRYPLPSSVLMTAVTARVAGVSQVWVASPRPTVATLAAASIAGADGLIAMGGVQAVAALADGLFGAPECDVVVGPGNRWVTAAKQLVSARVGIDMLAGPSELLVIADESADPAIVAADLLAQAEHDADAVPMLIATSAAILDAVEHELDVQLRELPTAKTARRAMGNGFAMVAADTADAVRLSDLIGPEHLEIITKDAAVAAERVKNAGAVFVGSASAEVLGDYGAGPNHVLPTGGTARFRAGLSVFTFLRIRTWMRMDDAAKGAGLYQDAAALARVESLEGHARAAEIRARGAR